MTMTDSCRIIGFDPNNIYAIEVITYTGRRSQIK
jgi:hypothetical protein